MFQSRGCSLSNQTTDLPELIILAGDMALHWGLALVSTTDGLIDSCHFDAAAIKTGKGDQYNESHRRIVGWVNERIDGGIDALWWEKPTPVSYPSAMAQGGMIGVLQQAGAELGPIRSGENVAPSTLKKWAAGHGHARKDQMIARANELAGYTIHNDNEADAVCLAMYAAKQEVAKQRKRMARRLRLEAEATR